MRPIELEELKNIELNMLLAFTKFCEQHGYTYFLSGGTLLGAIRHNGFIPWDDDIDIMMPRPDYDKAVMNFLHEYYDIDCVECNYNSKEAFARILDKRTTLQINIYKDKFKDNCVEIDVFPLDGLPNFVIFQKLFFWLQYFLIVVRVSTLVKFTGTNRYNDRSAGLLNWRKVIRICGKYLFILIFGWTSPCFWARLINKTARWKKFGQQKYDACLVSGQNGDKEKTLSIVFSDKVQVEFEGHKFWAPKGYDIYLRNLYGDYMQLPPEDKRVSHHDFKAYWKDGYGE